MAITTWDAIYPHVMRHLPSLPEHFVDAQANLTTKDFLYKTKAYQHTLTFDLLANTNTHALPALPAETAMGEIIWARYDTRKLTAMSAEQVEERMPRWTTRTGSPETYFQLAPNSITVAPTQTATETDALEVRISLYPTASATGLEAAYFDKYYDILVEGIVGEFLVMPSKVWTDPSLGTYFLNRYKERRDEVLNRIESNEVRAIREVRYAGI